MRTIIYFAWMMMDRLQPVLFLSYCKQYATEPMLLMLGMSISNTLGFVILAVK